MVWGTISSLGAFAEGVGKILNYPLFHLYEFMVLPHRKAFIWCFTQRIIKKKREEGGEKGGKEEEKRREKREGRVKGELPQVITTANQSGKGCWDSSVF
jgi:hypothetical protein